MQAYDRRASLSKHQATATIPYRSLRRSDRRLRNTRTTDRCCRALRQIYQTTVTSAHRPTPLDARSSPHHNVPGAVMAKCPRNRISTVASRKPQQLFRGPGPWPDTTEALAVLARAWTVTTIATVLFVVALTIAPVWDGAIYMQGLRDSLSGDPQLTQLIDEACQRPGGPRESACAIAHRVLPIEHRFSPRLTSVKRHLRCG
jgi:hypothetical protein